MLPSIFSPRPKSTSNIIGINQIESKARQDLQEIDRFRTYNVKDLKMYKSYLSEDVIREFKEGFEASAKSPSTSKPRNFVKKLVAALESKMDQGSGDCTADEEFITRCYRRPPAKTPFSFQESEQKAEYFDEHFATNIKNLSQSIIDDDEKQTNFDDCDAVTENDLKDDELMKITAPKNIQDSNKHDIFPAEAGHSRPTKNLQHKKNEPFVDSKNFDFNQNFHQSNDIEFYFGPDESDNPSGVVNAESKSKKNLRRTEPVEEKRSFKKVFSSLMGFKKRKSALPKGKRNVLSPKDSLGEEMRLFRRDMMPLLLKAARPYNNDTEENSDDETFSSLIAASRPKSHSDRSASIHPIYRGKKTAPKYMQTVNEENLDHQSDSSDIEDYSQGWRARIEIVVDKADLYQEIVEDKSPDLYQRPPEIVYDVPKSNKKVEPGLELRNELENFVQYENFEAIFEHNWKLEHERKNIVCGQRALYTKNKKLETQF